MQSGSQGLAALISQSPLPGGFPARETGGKSFQTEQNRELVIKKKEGPVNKVGKENESIKISQNKLFYFWTLREKEREREWEHTLEHEDGSRKKMNSKSSQKKLIFQKSKKEKDQIKAPQNKLKPGIIPSTCEFQLLCKFLVWRWTWGKRV